MANHKSAIKRIRSSETKKQRNKYQHKTARTAMKKFFDITKKKDAEKELSRMRIATSGLSRTMGALRNNLLLVTFAFGGCI